MCEDFPGGTVMLMQTSPKVLEDLKVAEMATTIDEPGIVERFANNKALVLTVSIVFGTAVSVGFFGSLWIHYVHSYMN
jgi:hypothetical protein